MLFAFALSANYPSMPSQAGEPSRMGRLSLSLLSFAESEHPLISCLWCADKIYIYLFVWWPLTMQAHILGVGNLLVNKSLHKARVPEGSLLLLWASQEPKPGFEPCNALSLWAICTSLCFRPPCGCGSGTERRHGASTPKGNMFKHQGLCVSKYGVTGLRTKSC